MAFSLVQSLVKHTVKHLGDGLTGGLIPIGSIAASVFEEWCNKQTPSSATAQMQMRTELERIVQDGRAYRQQVEAHLAEMKQNAEVRQRAMAYLNQVPGRIQASLRRADDPTGRTAPAALVLRGPDDLKQFLPEKMPRFKPGDCAVPGTDLVVSELLGVGGFGEVWKAVHRSRTHAPPVALKFCLQESAAQSLRKEVELLDRVANQGRHKGIVELKYAHLEGAAPCLEYEYVEGSDLSLLIADWHRAGRVKPLQLAKVLYALALAVGFAHRLKPAIVHRDLKPQNILTTQRDGKIHFKVADFGIGGIAANQAVQQWASSETKGNAPAATESAGSCTPLYASPQQRRFGPPDPRDDVYALGVIWYQMLSGDITREPPRGGGWKKKFLDQGVTAEMIALLERCIEDDTAERPADAQVLAEELAKIPGISSTHPVPPEAKKPAAPAPPAMNRRRVLLGVAALVVLAAVGLGGLVVFRIATAQGTVVIETDDPDVQVVVKRGGEEVAILDRKTNQEVTLKTGTYEIELKGDKGGLKLSTAQFTLQRGGKQIVAVRREPLVPGAVPPLQSAGAGVKVYLSDLQEHDWKGAGEFFKNGATASFAPGGVRVFGEKYAKGLFTHPVSKSYSSVKYRLDGLNAQAFETRVALNDTVAKASASPLTFEVRGDDKVLWTSKPVSVARQIQDCSVRVQGMHVLELRVFCPGLENFTHAVWLDPYLVTTVKTIAAAKTTGASPPPAAAARGPLTLDLGGGVIMPFVHVPKGTFWMGWASDKKESRQVTIDSDFELGVYPVTQEQWQALMLDNPSDFSRFGAGKDRVTSISSADLKHFPVENVSWHDAQDFLRKLNTREDGKGWLYRLPREAEWEYACRNAATTREECSFDFYFERGTNDLSSSQANFNGNLPAGMAARGPYLERTSMVGSYAPNKLGLHDMHGNVGQWCEDVWNDKKSPGRVTRGGTCLFSGQRCRAGDRHRGVLAWRHNDLGLRLARVPSGSK